MWFLSQNSVIGSPLTSSITKYGRPEGVVFADGARLIGSNGKTVPTVGPPRFGGDWPSQAGSVELRQGRGPTADNEIAINAGLAADAGVKVGDQVGVLTLEPRKTFTLVGIFGYPGGRDSQGGAQVVTFTLPVAQQLMLGQPDVFSNVDVKAVPGINDDQLRDRVAAAFGDGYQVKTGEDTREFVLVNAGMFALNLALGGTRWAHFPAYGWAVGLAIHGIVVFARVQGYGLRETMLQREMEKLRRSA